MTTDVSPLRRIGQKVMAVLSSTHCRLKQLPGKLKEISTGWESYDVCTSQDVGLWVERHYGPLLVKTDNRGEALFRGYVQIDLTQILEAVRILSEIGQNRAGNGKTTVFKFLIARYRNDPSGIERMDNDRE